MFIHQLDENSDWKVFAHWFLMCFNAGCINAGGFLATGRFVSHVTGFATLFGVHWVSQEWSTAVGILSVPIFFLLGTFLAGMLIDRPLYKKKRPHFDYVMLLSSACLFSSAIFGGFEKFGAPGVHAPLSSVYVLLALLCLACGLQNAAITSSSRHSIRTTHLTGLTTDLGLGLARLLTYDSGNEKFSKEMHATWLRMGSIVSFVIGSGIGSWFFIKTGYLGFTVSGTIALYAAWHGRKAKIASHKLETIF